MAAPGLAPEGKKMPRLTIDLAESKYREINILREFGGISTLREFVNNGLTLLKWAMLERSKGFMICSARRDGENTILRELEMPVLSAVTNKPTLADALESAHPVPSYGRRAVE